MTTTTPPQTDLFFTLDWDDPYPAYHALRQMAPVRTLPTGAVLVTGHDACAEVMRESLASNDLRHERTTGGARTTGTTTLDRFDSFLYRDPPEHSRIRHVVLAALREFDIEASGQRAATAAAGLLDAVLADGRMDAVSQLGQRIPAQLSEHMFGITSDEVGDVARWARDITSGLEPLMTPRQVRQRVLSLYDFSDYLSVLIGRHRTHPRDDLLTALIRAGSGDDGITEIELVATVMLFLAALFGSTVDMVGNLFVTMSRNPEQYQRVRAEPALIPRAVEELFRYESPFQLIYRVATADLVIGGHDVPAGTRITLMLGAANRDPARFTDPDCFLVDRTSPRHLAFGGSMHHCVGIPYSRIWLRSVLSVLIDRLPQFSPAGPVPARPARAFRGYSSAPVSWPVTG